MQRALGAALLALSVLAGTAAFASAEPANYLAPGGSVKLTPLTASSSCPHSSTKDAPVHFCSHRDWGMRAGEKAFAGDELRTSYGAAWAQALAYWRDVLPGVGRFATEASPPGKSATIVSVSCSARRRYPSSFM